VSNNKSKTPVTKMYDHPTAFHDSYIRTPLSVT